MARSSNWRDGQNRYYKNVDEAMSLLDCENNDVNFLRKVKGLLSDLTAANSHLEEVKAIAKTSDIGQAKSRIRALIAKNSAISVVERFNLDLSFLSTVSQTWDLKATGKDQLTMINELQRKIRDHQGKASDTYHHFMNLAVKYCEEQEYSEQQIQEEIESWHAQFQEDFNELSIYELWHTYWGASHGIEALPKAEERIPLAEALPLVANYTPRKLYDGLMENKVLLGNVSQFQLSKWDTHAANTTQESHKERIAHMRELMRTIVGIAVHRLAKDEDGVPTMEQTNALFTLLTNEEECPYAQEFEVNDNTSLFEVLKNYNSLTVK